MTYSVGELDPSTLDDFAELVERNHGSALDDESPTE